MNSPKLERLKSIHVVTMLHSTNLRLIQFKNFLQSHAAFSILLFLLFFFSVSISLKVYFIVLLTKGQADHLDFLCMNLLPLKDSVAEQ